MENSSSKNRREVRFWKYDDGSFGFITIEKKHPNQYKYEDPVKQYAGRGVCKTKDKLNDEIERIQSQCANDGYEFRKKKIKIKNGLKYISKKDLFQEDKKTEKEKVWAELEKFLGSCGDKEKTEEKFYACSAVFYLDIAHR